MDNVFIRLIMRPCHRSCIVVPAQLVAARLKKGTAQSLRLANSARIFINLTWYNVMLLFQGYPGKRRKLSGGHTTSGVNEKKNVFDSCLNQLYSPRYTSISFKYNTGDVYKFNF